MWDIRVAFLAIVLFVFNPVDKLVGYSTEIRSFRNVFPIESSMPPWLHAPKNGTAYKSKKKFVIPLLFPDVLQILFIVSVIVCIKSSTSIIFTTDFGRRFTEVKQPLLYIHKAWERIFLSTHWYNLKPTIPLYPSVEFAHWKSH